MKLKRLKLRKRDGTNTVLSKAVIFINVVSEK